MASPGSQADFDAFVAARWTPLVRTAYLLTGDHHLAEDLVQTALIRAAARWHHIETSPEAYVRRIMYTQNISWWRSRRHAREVALLEGFSDAATPLGGAGAGSGAGYDELANTEMRMVLVDALRQLSPRQRTVVVMRYVEDLTETQVAQALGIALGTVKSTNREALNALRRNAPELVDLLPTGGVR